MIEATHYQIRVHATLVIDVEQHGDLGHWRILRDTSQILDSDYDTLYGALAFAAKYIEQVEIAHLKMREDEASKAIARALNAVVEIRAMALGVENEEVKEEA